MQTLERFVGKPLFARRHQAMVPNEDGQRLMEQIAPLLDQLSDAVEAMTSGQEVLRLRLGVLPLYASQRLFPHMGLLRAAHPELHLDIDTAGHGIARLGEGLDAVIALGREIDPRSMPSDSTATRSMSSGRSGCSKAPIPCFAPSR